ncbi:MAG: acetyltransferase [Rhodothermales bacterium]
MSVLVIGGGGHAKVVIATLRAAGVAVAGVLDDDAAKHGSTLLGVPVIGSVERATGGEHDAVIAVGHNATRKRIAESLPDVRWATVVHPHAVVHESVRLGEGAVVFAGAVVQPDARLGAHTIINTGASADHDNELGDYVHLAPGVRLAGGVTLEEGAFMGIASAALPGVRVGAWTTVGAGGVVTRDLPSGVTAVGVPACPLSF